MSFSGEAKLLRSFSATKMRKIKFEKGKIYHIFNRGVEKRDVFLNDSDRWRFLQGLYLFNDETSFSGILRDIENKEGRLNFRTIREFLKENPVERNPLIRIMADCLMPNHYHLLLEETQDNGISRFMHKMGTGYTNYFNKKYDRVGSLFQGPFKAVCIEKELYLQYLLVYINVLNPGQLVEPNLKEEGIKNIDAIMKFAEEFQWSTHQEYSDKRDSIIVEKGILGELFENSEKYKEFAKNVLLTKKISEIDNLTLE